MYELNYQDPFEQQMQELQSLQASYDPTTDFGRVSMGDAPVAQTQPEAQVEGQADAAAIMNEANLSAAGDIGQVTRDMSKYAYTSQGATDNEAMGEGLFAFGLAMLAAASKPGGNFGASLAAGLGAGAQGFTGALNRNKRFENREALEKKGFTQESIDAYIQSGDNKSLVKAPVTNFMKTKEMGGVMYEYDERDPASTMKPIATGPRQLKSSVDLGDKVQLHYTDGSTEYQNKGISASDRAKAAAAERKAAASNSGSKWEEKMVEWQDPETGDFKTMSVYADTKNPGVYASTMGSPIQLPENAKFTSEAQMNKRTQDRYKAQDEAGLLGNTIAATAQHTADLLGTDVNFYDPTRLLPYTPSGDRQKLLENAKSNLMVNQYSNMPGVAGASVQTEQQIIRAIPNPTDTPEVKANWAKKKLAYDEQVLEATIRRQNERYGSADESLKQTLAKVKSQKEQLENSMEEFNIQQTRLATQAPGIVRAPSSNVGGAQSAYGGAAQAQAPKSYGSFDPSQVVLK